VTASRQVYSVSEAARALGISLDTLRRWDKAGRISVARDKSNRRIVSAEEIDRLRGDGAAHLTARNRFPGTVTDVQTDGLMAQVEIVVNDPVRLVAIVTRDAVEELGLRPGMHASAVVKATNVMVSN
jgi:molybdopterin-binding protein